MVSVFETDKLRELLKDFYRISHIRITVFDEEMNELVAWPEQVAPRCGLIRNPAKRRKHPGLPIYTIATRA